MPRELSKEAGNDHKPMSTRACNKPMKDNRGDHVAVEHEDTTKIDIGNA